MQGAQQEYHPQIQGMKKERKKMEKKKKKKKKEREMIEQDG